MSQSTKRSVQRKRRREQLLDVAMALFAAEGVEKTTVGRIAAEANVSHGLLYHYFRSKEDVLHAVVE
ncbi:MAG: helix-turn-helix transcriptional regulator, partial [Candidatus Eremiobacteraeota bacterium]|nr:helix-turn-helix transcriptional regulator [Candidatus Eremiobacteraeota bacterium]